LDPGSVEYWVHRAGQPQDREVKARVWLDLGNGYLLTNPCVSQVSATNYHRQ
jgi:hypothetical protein